MTCTEEYREHIEYTFHAFCKVVIRNATINAARTRSRKHKREISLEYLTDEKHYPLGTTDEYFQAPEPDEEYILTLCGDTVIFSSGLLAEALSRLDEREREMIYLSFFKRIPQHEIGRQYGRSRSTAGYHIRKVLRQLQAEMEGMGWERKKPPYNWHRTSGFPMRTGNRRERQKSPSPGRNPRRNSFRKQKTVASVSLPIIFTCSGHGERNMPRTPRRKPFIPGLWKPYRSKTKWNICWMCCSLGKRRKKRL